MAQKLFLAAEWRKLVMANYVIDKSLLYKYLPDKTELDLWGGNCYVSLVGFMFLDTRVKGLKIPFHINFEEVNLRFYVRHKSGNEWKRGVVFIKEIVPKPALTFVANTVYREKYVTMPLSHCWTSAEDCLSVEYKWKSNNWNSLKVLTEPEPTSIKEGSEEEFITEHYWGYTRIAEGKTTEYQVEHPKWDIYKTKSYEINTDFEDLYGEEFGFLSNTEPKSVFLAEGSAIKVRGGKYL